MSMEASFPVGGGPKKKNEFERVGEIQPDAITFELIAQDGAQFGRVHCPASATNGRLPKDYHSEAMPGKEAFRAAIQLANEMKLAIVVLDPQELWPAEWGVLYETE